MPMATPLAARTPRGAGGMLPDRMRHVRQGARSAFVRAAGDAATATREGEAAAGHLPREARAKCRQGTRHQGCSRHRLLRHTGAVGRHRRSVRAMWDDGWIKAWWWEYSIINAIPSCPSQLAGRRLASYIERVCASPKGERSRRGSMHGRGEMENATEQLLQ